MRRSWIPAVLLALIFVSPAFAEYAEQIRKQIDETQKRFSGGPEPAYFHDMGIIARKADDAELYDLLIEIVKTNLYAKADEDVETRLKKVIEQIERDPYLAGGLVRDLLIFDKSYEPSGDFLSTAEGKAMQADMVRARDTALDMISKSKVSVKDIAEGFKAYRKTALFSVKGNAEEKSVLNLHDRLECGVSWARKLVLDHEQEFKTDYEKGSIKIHAELSLQTPASDFTQAEWRGPWISDFKGQGGTGKGVATATLKVTRGAYEGDLLISTSQLSNVGRFNFPNGLTGERRVVDLKGSKLLPDAEINDTEVRLTGCEPVAPEKPAEIQSKVGRVLGA